MFTAALFAIVELWKQPKYPSTDEWIKKTWYPHTHKNITQPFKKKKEILPFAANMGGLGGQYAE